MTSDGHQASIHFILTFHIAGISVCGDLHFVMRRTGFLSLCHMCLIENEDFENNKIAHKGRWAPAKGLLCSARHESVVSRDTILWILMLTIPSVLHKFPLVEIHSSVNNKNFSNWNIYTIFSSTVENIKRISLWLFVGSTKRFLSSHICFRKSKAIYCNQKDY